ncbi:MAG TPA: TonB-dependent receptor [Steroidobacteraceae bacterium]|nr:TonB-dependent receptor [Steroidobacteraceae bacterium]
MVKRNTVAVAVAAILGATLRANVAAAQQAPASGNSTDDLQEVVVTGLRASLQDSMNIKRNAIGVVDAISAEDIGKFPDTNLSEALQRVTGISISRRNGEGATVTARGFGSEYNMVTLNGRMMPAADAYGGGGNGFDGGVNGQTRSFNFANLAAESISGIEVYKTSRADIATGGIGATLNVLTARPLDQAAGTTANFGIKAVDDTTNRVGNDVTPEVSGIYSFANDDRRWGVSLTGSYQKRDSGSSMSTINDWNIRTWHDDPSQLTTQLAPGAVITNKPAEGALYAIPNDIRYHFADRERTRVNGQLTMQFKPVDALTLTADYTYAEQHLKEDRGDQTLWMNANHFNAITFDTGEVVATPLLLQEDEGTAKDFGFEQQRRDQKNDLKSAGFNAGWQINDRWNLNFDIHDSKARSLPHDPVTGGGETLMSFAARVPSTCLPAPNDNMCTNRIVQTFIFGEHGLGLAQRTIFTEPTASAPASGGDSSFDFPLETLGSQYLRINYQAQETNITQARLDSALDFDNGRLQFGVETRSMDSHQLASNAQMTLGDWGVNHPGEIPANLVQAFSLVNAFDDFSAPGVPSGGWKGNADALAQWATANYGVWRDATQTNGVLSYNPGFNQDHLIEEDTDAVYVQYGMKGSVGEMPWNALLGVRYEHTDVKATSNVLPPTMLLWQDNNDFSVLPGTDMTALHDRGKYSNVLPSLDFDISLRNDLKARFSASKTLARPQYNDLRAAVVVNGTQGSTINGFIPTANGSNTNLDPLSSKNLDMSLEWYYSDTSYAAVGLFQKRVSNFIGNQVTLENPYGLLDQTSGPRAQQAIAELKARGFSTDDTNLFVMMAMMEHPETGGAAAFNGTEAQHLAIAGAYDIRPNADDPPYMINVTRPVNNKDAKIWGAEFALQHFFGHSGFGFQANYTLVRGDISFNNAGDPNVNQFALLGLSDSANAVAIYEKYGWQVRLAWNWRDEYLSSINVGCCRNPVYVEPYSQIDLSIGYQLNDRLSFSFEGLNLTEEDVRWHGRTDKQVWFVEDLGARYALGARYKF